MQNRSEGTVIWYDSENGYGIIRLRCSKQTVSIDNCQIHHSHSKGVRPLRIGQNVSFEIVNTEAHDLYLL